MTHPPTPVGATPREILVLSELYRASDRCGDDETRRAFALAVETIVGLIAGRAVRRDFEEHWDRPHDEF